MFHELGRNPDVEARVHAEVDEVLVGRPVTGDDLHRLVYVRQVVDEVLRQYPLWMLMRRTLTEVRLGDERLPEGAEVIVSPHALHHDPASFEAPETFDPGRWSPERAKQLPKGAFIPFGAGTRQCVGNVFAQNEIVITVATVAAQWRLVPVPSTAGARQVHLGRLPRKPADDGSPSLVGGSSPCFAKLSAAFVLPCC